MAFFQKVRCVFQISKKTILNLKFKFRAQDSFLDFFWRFGDLKKRIALSEKKPPLRYLKDHSANKYIKSNNVRCISLNIILIMTLTKYISITHEGNTYT